MPQGPRNSVDLSFRLCYSVVDGTFSRDRLPWSADQEMTDSEFTTRNEARKKDGYELE